jgi:hypothetical protein
MKETGIRKLRRQVAKNAREDPLRFYGAIIFAVSMAALFVLEQSLAILSSNIMSGSKVLSAHPNCGVWSFDGGTVIQYLRGSTTVKAAQFRALNYAESCYGNSNGIANCDMMASRTIDFVVKRGASCPFPGDVCLNGPSSALTMDTGFQPISVLGLNVPTATHFRRNVACAPLTDRLTRVRRDSSKGQATYIVGYLYGYPRSEYNRTEPPILWSHKSPDGDINEGEYRLE